jgi:hypothetical protein
VYQAYPGRVQPHYDIGHASRDVSGRLFRLTFSNRLARSLGSPESLRRLRMRARRSVKS